MFTANHFTKSLLSGFAGAAMLALASAPASATYNWSFLGQQQVGMIYDRDVFHVGWHAGRFDALRFKAVGNNISVADVKVHYLNGTSEHLNVREHLIAGTWSPTYDLKGDHRIISKIEFIYATEVPRSWTLATMQVYGLRYAGTGNGGGNGGGNGNGGGFGWESLGTRNVSLTVDHDYIDIGPGKGRFRTLKLKVTDQDVYFYNVRVRFMNGQEQELPVQSFVRAGNTSLPLDLTGDLRTIERVDLVYRARPGSYGQAHVTVLGHR